MSGLRLRAFKTLIFLVIIFTGTAAAELPWTYPPGDLSQESKELLEEAANYLDRGDLESAKEQLLIVAAEYAGTGIEAEALLSMAQIAALDGDNSTWRSNLEEVMMRFPNSVFAFKARVAVLTTDGYLDGGFEGRASAFDDFAQELGGPSFEEVANGSLSTSEVSSVLRLHFEKKIALRGLYTSCYFEQAHLGDYDKAIQVAVFGRRALDFGPKSRNEFLGLLKNALLQTGRGQARNIGARHSTPIIRGLVPTAGSTVPMGSTISFEATTGSYINGQLDISSLQVELDGVDITEVTQLDIDYDFLLQEDRDFEVLRPSFSLPLTPGTHTVSVKIDSIRGWNETSPDKPRSAEQTWSFKVVEEEPPSGQEVLRVAFDSILSERHQHQNEGANSLLTLEKIQGKAARSALAFDLESVSLIGLSKATLVLTVESSERVNGWGNGRTISAQALNSPWLEGNGKSFGLKKKDQVAGNGAGATWFSPSDEDISNDSANSTFNWNGAAYSAASPTAPPVVISNGLSGEVAFDVTADVLNGAEHGWLILKDQENVGSKVSFYSREGAAAAGNPDLAPRLLLEFGQVASNSSGTQSETLLSRFGFGSVGTKLRRVSGSEVRSVKQLLQENQVAALAVEQLVSQATLTNPVANWTTRLAYRSWVSESIQIAANLEMARSQA